MNPNAAAFAMILKQREAMAKSNQVLLPVNKQSSAPQQFHRTSQPPQPPQQPHSQQPHNPYQNDSIQSQPQPYMMPNRYQPPHPPGNSSFASNLSAYAAHHHTQQCYPGSSAAPGFQGYNNHFMQNAPVGYESQHNYRQNQQQQHMQRPPTPPAEPDVQYFCEPCDKEFTQIGAFEAHKATHETCRHPGCEFSATKKVVIAHYHGAHGQFSGSGYKMIDVEGQKFRVLMGQSPEEIAEWRAARRKKFPTAEIAELKQQHLAEVAAAGGIVPTGRSKQLTKRPISAPEKGDVNSEPLCKLARGEDTGLDNAEGEAAEEDGGSGPTGEEPKRCFQYGRGRCKAGDACPFSHAVEPKQCEFFLRAFCKRGPKCFNIHDPAQRAEYRAKNPTEKRGDKDSSSSGDKKDKEHRFGQLNSNGELSIPAPLAGGQRGTLWRKLLEDQVTEEENIVLQCLHFLVQSNFLDKAAEIATSTE